jgi:hypothetical protein
MLNPKDKGVSVDELQRQAASASEERQMEILSELIVRTIKEYKDPGYFTHWVSSTSKKDALKWADELLSTLNELELYEYCNEAVLFKGKIEIFHSMKGTRV